MALDVASSLLMWDVECAMRVDRKKKKKNATSRICDKGWLETRLETLFSTLRNFVKKVRSFFFYSPSSKVIRISLSQNRSKYFFVSNFVKDWTIERSVQIFQSIRWEIERLAKLLYSREFMKKGEWSNEIRFYRNGKRRCYYARKLWNMGSLEEVGSARKQW